MSEQHAEPTTDAPASSSTEDDLRARCEALLAENARLEARLAEAELARRSLLTKEARYRALADGVPLLVWVRDRDGRQEYANEAFRDFFGVDPRETVGVAWQSFVHPADVGPYLEALDASVRTGQPFRAEARARHADGSWRWLESWGRPQQSADGVVEGIVGVCADLTERHATEQALRDSEVRFRTLADNIAQLAWMADGEGSIVWYNKRWYEYTGTEPAEMMGWGWKAVHHPAHVDRVVSKVAHCFATGTVWEDTFPLRSAEGEYRWFLSRAIPIRDADGQVIRWFGTNTDVTERRVAEHRLLEADRQKNQFLAMLGHELRNPLAAIRTATALLKRSCSDDPRVQRIEPILERQTAHMAKLLDGLLDISRVIRGQITLDAEVLDLRSVCRDATTDARGAARTQGVELRVELPEEPVWVGGDRVRLAQMLGNLLSNAFKYSQPGDVVWLRLGSPGSSAVLEVVDTGAGIDAQLLPHIFEMFRQSDQGLDRAAGGMGVGLALVEALTLLHGGTVTAHSEGRGHGARFVVQLPLLPPPPTVAAADRTTASVRLRILIIEDNVDARAMLKALLEMAGHRVAVAGDGQEGLALAQTLRPDIVLCDLGLPGISGFDVARELRRDPALARVQLVAVSGYGRPQDKHAAAAAGFGHHLTKPVDLDALAGILVAAAEANQAE